MARNLRGARAMRASMRRSVFVQLLPPERCYSALPIKAFQGALRQVTRGMIKAVYQHIMSDKREEVNEAVNGAAQAMFQG